MNLTGHWSACPIDDGGASDLELIFLPNGTGVIAEWNWFLCCVKEILWHLEDDNTILQVVVKGKEQPCIGGKFMFDSNVPLTDIVRKTRMFDSFSVSDEKLGKQEFFKLPTPEEELVTRIDELWQMLDEEKS